MNTIKAKLKHYKFENNITTAAFDFENETIYGIFLGEKKEFAINQSYFLQIAPNDIYVLKNFAINSSFLNQLKVSIVAISQGNECSVLECAINGVRIESFITTKALERLNVSVGDSVVLVFSEFKIATFCVT